MTLANVTISSGTSNLAATSITNGTSNVTIASSGGNIAMATNGATAITVNTSQNVGIGTSSPTGRLTVTGGSGGSNPTIRLNGGATGDDNALIASRYNLQLSCNADGNIASRSITFINSTTELARIDSDGNFLVGGTSPNDTFGTPTIQGVTNCVFTNRRSITSAASQFRFYNPNGNIGEIYTSGSSTTYATSSDYRLKENIAPMTGALDKVAQLKPVTYKWKVDGSDGQGFIAHELQAVVPDCVSGTKDAVDANGNPQYQGIDTSFLVATLTAAIQELKAINDTQAETINALTARIVALESK
jgi:hypothetical protein